MHENNLYLFGGNNSSVTNDFYSFNTKSHGFKIIQSRGKLPSKRANHGSVITKNLLFIFAGEGLSSKLNDLY